MNFVSGSHLPSQKKSRSRTGSQSDSFESQIIVVVAVRKHKQWSVRRAGRSHEDATQASLALRQGLSVSLQSL